MIASGVERNPPKPPLYPVLTPVLPLPPELPPSPELDEDADLQILNGRWGPYISYQKKNYKIPKTTEPANLSYSDCLDLIKNSAKKPAKKKAKKK